MLHHIVTFFQTHASGELRNMHDSLMTAMATT